MSLLVGLTKNMAKCGSHPGNVTTFLCENCDRKICSDCPNHEQHKRIALTDIHKAYENLLSEPQYYINHIKSLEKDVKTRVEAVEKTVKEAGKKLLKQLEENRDKETETSKLIQEIKDESGSIEEKYLKIKKLIISKSKYAQFQHLELIHSQYTLGIIPDVIGRVEWVFKDQELVELCSVKTSKPTFIRSIRPVDSTKAWILHYREKAIYLMDHNGKILETQNFGDIIEDFCLNASGDVLYTTWNGRELKKHTKDNKDISLFEFPDGYTTRGLCIKDEHVMVCLCSSIAKNPNMVAKMAVEDKIARNCHFPAKTGFSEPGRVCCTPGGIIAVVDWGASGRFLKVIDQDGKDMWTWNGQTADGSMISPFEPYGVSFCHVNDEKRFLVTLSGTDWNKIYSLGVTGGGNAKAKCIYTGQKGFYDGAIATDHDGHIWIGDENGRVHIMKTIKNR